MTTLNPGSRFGTIPEMLTEAYGPPCDLDGTSAHFVAVRGRAHLPIVAHLDEAKALWVDQCPDR